MSFGSARHESKTNQTTTPTVQVFAFSALEGRFNAIAADSGDMFVAHTKRLQQTHRKLQK
eukprot:5138056-Amphidinium_carterae.1